MGVVVAHGRGQRGRVEGVQQIRRLCTVYIRLLRSQFPHRSVHTKGQAKKRRKAPTSGKIPDMASRIPVSGNEKAEYPTNYAARTKDQCCGPGSARIRTFWPDPDSIKLTGSGSGSGPDH